jgi:pantoate kinase
MIGSKVVNGNVQGAPSEAVADATGVGDVVAQLNTLLARLRALFIIGT